LSELQKDFEKIIADNDFPISLEADKLVHYDNIQRYFTSDRIGGGHLYLKGILMIQDILVGNSQVTYNWDRAPAIPHILFTHPNKKETLRAVDKYYDFIEKYALKTPYQVHNEQIDEDRKRTEYIGGNVLLEIFMPTYGRVFAIMYWGRCVHQASITIIATQRWKLDKGQYPDTLNELVEAGYMKELPMDPYSDKALVYKRVGDNFTLYSIGVNFKDDGGKVATENNKIQEWGTKEAGDAVFWPVQK
jgi:hypothetical protein